MNELEPIVSVCQGSLSSGNLDLTSFGGTRHGHASQVAAACVGWWLLGSDEHPQTLRVPMSGQEVLHRGGVVSVAEALGLDVSVSDGGPSADGTLEGLAIPARPTPPERFVPISDLASPENSPPEPDEHGRRYLWIRSLVPASERLGAHRDVAASDAARTLYELVDNVHRWANAQKGFATVSTTKGGGSESFDRLRIVVMDDGRGIISSVLDDPTVLDLPGALQSAPEGLLLHFMVKAFGERDVPNHNGHGLNVTELLAGYWTGRVDLLSADNRNEGLVHHARSTVGRGVESCESFQFPGARGTLAVVTLNLTRVETERVGIASDEPADLLDLDFAQA